MTQNITQYFIVLGGKLIDTPKWVAILFDKLGGAAGALVFLMPSDFSDPESANHWTDADWDAFEAQVQADLDAEDK